jgi:hypothetical protein
MTFPKYNIEVYHGANLIHTIESDASVVRASAFLSSEVGIFSFTLPAKKGIDYVFNDLSVDDKAKIWFGYETVPTDPFMVGKIYHISAPLQTETGFVRVFSGMDLGEIAQRSLYTNYWKAIDASVIVTELANYLGLGTTEIEVDTHDVTLNVEDMKVWDILREISDYWVSSGVQISKDFYVDINNKLVWKTRPLRTSGVETLTLGDNILSYDVVQNLSQVYNNITVYGESGKIGSPGLTGRCNPSDKDLWTVDDIANWTAIVGAISVSGASKVGANCLRCVCVDAGKETQFRRTFTAINCYGREAYQTLNFFINVISDNVLTAKLKLFAPDISNYFEADIPLTGGATDWQALKTFQLGQNQEYDAVYNPSGTWHIGAGSPDWQQISAIDFDLTYSLVLQNVYVDGLYFGHGRFNKTVTDSTYAARDLVVVDNELHSDAECESRANILLSRMKLPTTQLEITTPGNTNIKIGDRIPITLASEGWSNVDFDVLNVEHIFSTAGFYTKTVMNSNERQRDKVPNTPLEVLKRGSRDIQRLLKVQDKTYAR